MTELVTNLLHLRRVIALTTLLVVAIVTTACSTGGSWKTTASMAVPRAYHAAVRLGDGRVLVMGGDSASGEIYDPDSATWTQTGSMAKARRRFTATLLLSGKVLVAGGAGDDSAELYDPGTGTWTPTGGLQAARESFTATLLHDGRVLAAGGLTPEHPMSPSASAEVYDPDSGTWQAVGSMSHGRVFHTATLLSNGRVLVVGGGEIEMPPLMASAELFDPATGQWTPAGDMAAPRSSHDAALLADGKVLVAGGLGMVADGEAGVTSAEVYDPSTDAWTATGDMPFSSGLNATLGGSNMAIGLLGGTVLVVAVDETIEHGKATIYDPASGKWIVVGNLANPHSGGTTTLLIDGRVLVAGGSSGDVDPRAYAELFTPLAGS